MSALDSTRTSHPHERTVGAWMRGNLTTQGYCLSDDERRRLFLALRFSTGTCLLLVIAALARHHPGRVQRLQVLGDVRVRLPRRAGQPIHGPRRLREQVEQLKPDRA